MIAVLISVDKLRSDREHGMPHSTHYLSLNDNDHR